MIFQCSFQHWATNRFMSYAEQWKVLGLEEGVEMKNHCLGVERKRKGGKEEEEDRVGRERRQREEEYDYRLEYL